MEAYMSERAAVGPGADTPTHLISAAVVGSGAGAPVIVPAPIHPASAVTSWKNPSTCDIAALKSVLHADRKRWRTVTVGLAALACALMVVMMSVGNTVYYTLVSVPLGLMVALALALLLFVTVVLVLFVLFNTQTVDISLVFGDVQAPLVLALLIAAALGGLVVAMAGLALRARRKD